MICIARLRGGDAEAGGRGADGDFERLELMAETVVGAAEVTGFCHSCVWASFLGWFTAKTGLSLVRRSAGKIFARVGKIPACAGRLDARAWKLDACASDSDAYGGILDALLELSAREKRATELAGQPGSHGAAYFAPHRGHS